MATNRIPVTERVIERFWAKVQKTEGCWLWVDHPTSFGHGKLSIPTGERARNGKRVSRPFYAHRVSWQIHYGDIPEGLVVRHKCDNPPCVRPDHLRLGTQAENLAESRSKGRWHNDPRRKKKIPSKQRLDITERFWGKVNIGEEGECWEWKGGRNNKGYGNFSDETGKRVGAHTVAYRLAKGQIPAEMIVMHECDNPPCCNPAHLRAGTRGDNNRDRTAKGRTHRPRGEKNVMAKLTEEQVAEIRTRYTGAWGQQTKLAEEYGVWQTQISRIVRGEHWREP